MIPGMLALGMAFLLGLPAVWAQTGHDSFDPAYRNPPGAVPAGSASVLIRFSDDSPAVTAVALELQSSVLFHRGPRQEIAMQRESGTPFWRAELPVPAAPATLSYGFQITDGGKTQYYLPQDADAHTGGWGVLSSEPDASRAYRITVFQADYRTPDWLKGAVIYQIFPDRFRDGDPTNDPSTGSGWIYGDHVHFRAWNSGVCDPLQAGCRGQAATQFFGGDLQGVIDELDYLKNLGVTVLYLNPIFLSPTNHKYDTQDYFQIDPELGTRETFDALVSAAGARGIRIILDGVFNHVSSDSEYFDYYDHYDEQGACGTSSSPYRGWFYLPAIGTPAIGASGQPVLCAGQTYEAFAGEPEMPRLDSDAQGVRELVFAEGALSVAPYWSAEGAAGWRLDVGQGPSHSFWQGFREATLKLRPDSGIIGELWGDARDWLKGGEWDSVMNYRFRTAVLDWLFDSCSGNGCSSSGGFSDVNTQIVPASQSDFQARLQAIQEDYPPEAWQAMMNLIDSHDTSRILFLLRSSRTIRRRSRFRSLSCSTILEFTYPGSPSVYYGDEVGLAPDDAWDGRTWEVDPYNRAPYPWADQGLSPDTTLAAHYALLGALRATTKALQGGSFRWLEADDPLQFLAFGRGDPLAGGDVIVALNRSLGPQTISMSFAAGAPPEGAAYGDALSGGIYTVQGGHLSLGSLDGLSGRVLVRRASSVPYSGPIRAPTAVKDQRRRNRTHANTCFNSSEYKRGCDRRGSPGRICGVGTRRDQYPK